MLQTQPQQLDPDAVNLSKAIRQTESNGNFQQVGKSGEYGAYQFLPQTWAQYSKDAGVDVPLQKATPEQQNQVAYTQIKKWKDAGYNPGQIASMWNAGEGKPDAYLNGNKGTNSKGVAYDTADYAKKVATAYQQFKAQGGPQTANAADAGGPNTAQASTGTQQPESAAQKVPDYAGAIGNFLFPVAGDIGAVAQGKPTGKTGLQIAGDAAMSVLPFIPGLGELGEGARGLEVAGEGLNAAKDAGLLGKIAGSTVARNAGVGYGAGVASNLQQGQGLGQSFMPNVNTVGGTVLGGAGGLAGKALGGILDKATGIAPNVKPVLENLSGGTKLYDEYANTATQRAADIRNPSVLEHAADYTEKAVGQMQKNLSEVGTQVGSLKNTEGTKSLTSVVPVLQKFAQNLEDKFGLKVFVSPTGAKITLESAPGRMKNILSAADQGRVKTALKQIITLNKSGNVRKASDVLDNLDNLVDYSKKDLLGNSNDPLEAFLKTTRHDLNGVIGKSSSALAAAKSRYSSLSDALESIKGAGGSNLQRAELLLKRVFSGDQSQTSRDVFGLIKKETGVDLTEHAILAKHFVDNMGDQSEKSALQKMLEATAGGGGPTLPGLLLSGGKHALNATIANPIKQGRRIVQGKQGILQSALRNKFGGLTKGLLELGHSAAPYIGQ